ncbi:MAG: tripartite tricarboxylate transporter substrate binding protein [Burkholderiales bacterium]|nr:tripartite tricarboxylate transporter substrate binding protein [Burkholderiales bacterium]
MEPSLRVASGLGAFVLFIATALAQSYPAKPVRFIVPFVPGGGTDTFARVVSAKLSETWNKQVIVDNRPGAQGNIGTALGAKAAGDGYTLTLAFVGTLSINPHLYRAPGFDVLKDFAALTRGTIEPWVFTVNASTPAKDVNELIALAKRSPGKLTFSSGSSGSQLAGELFKLAAGVDMVHVPYKGTAPAVADVVAGNVHMTSSVPTSVVGHVKAGRLRPMLVTGSKRNDMLPAAPSAVEVGLGALNVLSWYGIVVPSSTPRELLRRINADAVQALNAPEVRERLNAAGQSPAPSSPEEFQQEIRRDYAVWGKVVQSLNLKPE